MKFKAITFFVLVVFLLMSPNAFAGKWVGGKGDSISSAIHNAKENAKKRIKKRGKGCVDGKTRNPKKHTDSQGSTYWTIEIYTHNNNGSCGK